jgi:hypothetical protein
MEPAQAQVSAGATTNRSGVIGICTGLFAAILLFGTASAYWVALNKVQIGRDAGGHLVRTLEFARLAAFSRFEFSPQAVFHALTYHDYRPPLFYWAVQPFYWLFGQTMDSAQWLNLLLFAVLLVATFLLGWRIAGARVALFAVTLLGLFPILTAMTRLFYLENFVSVMVVLCLWTLWETKYFTNRRWSLAWGVCLGLGLLVKWTLPAYLLLPVLAALWRGRVGRVARPKGSRHLPSATNHRPAGVAVMPALLALAAGVVLAALWYAPNRLQARQLPLGDGLFVVWALLWAALLYTLAGRSWPGFTAKPSNAARLQNAVQPLHPKGLHPEAPAPLSNLAAGLLLAASLASLWYAPRIDVLGEIGESALGAYGGNYEPANPLRLRNYLHPFRYLIEQHLGVLPSLAILPLGLLPWLWRRQWGSWRMAGGSWPRATGEGPLGAPPAGLPGGWLLWGSVLSTYVVLSQLSQDGERNLAPLLPVLALLLAIGLTAYPRRRATAIGVVWLSVLAVQWALYTFDGLGPWHQRTMGLWASSDFLVRPASDDTAPGFWIAPDVLATVDGAADTPSSLGMLVNAQSIHRSPFQYLIETEKRHVVLMALTERDTPGWGAVFANQWILLKNGDNGDVEAAGQEAIARILAGDALFHKLYHEAKRYPLPNGETAYLYHRATGPGHPTALPDMVESGRRAAAFINDHASVAATLVFGNTDLVVWTAMHGLNIDQVLLLDERQAQKESLPSGLVGDLFVVVNNETAPQTQWLEQSTYKAMEIGDDRLAVAVYGRPEHPLATLAADAVWPHLRVVSLRTLPYTAAGRVLPVELSLEGALDGARKGSLRLIDPDGVVVAQSDPVLASAIKLGLLIPPQATMGAYTLTLTVYNATTLAPIPDTLGHEQVNLASIHIGELVVP